MNFETENIDFKSQQASSKQIRRMIKESTEIYLRKNDLLSRT